MHYQFNDGVDINVFPNRQFKNINITIDFITPINYKNFALRTMLASMMETNNDEYYNSSMLSKRLSYMYGAVFGTNVLKYGNQHVLRIILSVINKRFLPNYKSVLKDGIEFLHAVIYKPLLELKKPEFNHKTFFIQQTNMINYLNSLKDDKQFLADMGLRNIYYANEKNHRGFLLGTIRQIKAVTPKSLYQYYLDVINNNQIQINILGNVNPEIMVALFSKFKFNDRSSKISDIILHPKLEKLVKKEYQEQNSEQGKLSMGYYLPIYLNSNKYYAALIFNTILGGNSQSKLFLNIREKNSLAYYADSNYNSLTGMISIESGINYQNKNKVIELIQKQILDIKKGRFSNSTLLNAKLDLINNKISSLDDSQYLLDQYFIMDHLHHKFNIETWQKQIKRVTKLDIINVAKLIQLKAIYFLGRSK